MTVKELKQKLEGLPGTMDVFMDERMTEFRYGMVNTCQVKEINFMEDPGGPVMSTDKVVILSED